MGQEGSTLFLVGSYSSFDHPLIVNSNDGCVYSNGTLYLEKNIEGGYDKPNAARYIKTSNSYNSTGIYVTTTGNGGLYDFKNSQWLIRSNSSGTIVCSSSDSRYKNDLGIDISEEVLTILRNVKCHKFTYKSDTNNLVQYGYMAQDVRDVLSQNNIGYRSILQINSEEGNDYYDLNTPEENVRYSIDYTKMVPILHEGWQIHDEEISELKSENNKLKNELEELKQLIKEFTA